MYTFFMEHYLGDKTMFTHLLVPLDGSHLAESVLPAAAYLAEKLSASVTLIHVIEKNAPKEIHGEVHLSEPGEAETYLREVARRAFPPGIKIEFHVHSTEVEHVARGIVEHVVEFETDLTIMCTHGRGGMRDLLFGNIAQQVIALGRTPVLLVQPTDEGTAPAFTCRRVLVPLDGQPEHERGLIKAKALARACAADLGLVMAVHTIETLPGKWAASRRLMPGSTSEMLAVEFQEANEYLLKHQQELQDSGFTVTAEVMRGDPALVIADAAQRFQADLIVLGTHARSRMDAFWAGSAAPNIYKRCRIPLLLIPV
jgi:nucleotide-binding universal stress UspA family protein